MKWKNRINLNAWWKNFLTGVLATAIGVGLTFEVNNRVEHRKQHQAQRQAAMMAIYDIDEIIRQFNDDRQREDAFFRVAMYMYTHPEEQESVSMDSLWMAAEYIRLDPSYIPEWSDNSTEKVFTSSMDALNDLGDITFYDNVQECYQLRKNMLCEMEKSSIFHKPMSDEMVIEYRKRVSASDLIDNGMMNHTMMAGLLRQMLQRQEVVFYLQKYLTRDRVCQHFVDQLVRLNRENKFIMNVTDEDMKRFVEQHVNKTMSAKPKQLIGQWTTTHDRQHITYTFHKDQTASATTEMEYRVSIYVESEDVNVYMLTPLTFTIDGQWELDGDSLRLCFHPESLQMLAFDLDFSSLPKAALEENKDSLDSRKQQYQMTVQKQLQEGTRWTWTNKVLLGKSGQIMFWEQQNPLPWGQVETRKIQLLK